MLPSLICQKSYLWRFLEHWLYVLQLLINWNLEARVAHRHQLTPLLELVSCHPARSHSLLAVQSVCSWTVPLLQTSLTKTKTMQEIMVFSSCIRVSFPAIRIRQLLCLTLPFARPLLVLLSGALEAGKVVPSSCALCSKSSTSCPSIPQIVIDIDVQTCREHLTAHYIKTVLLPFHRSTLAFCACEIVLHIELFKGCKK